MAEQEKEKKKELPAINKDVLQKFLDKKISIIPLHKDKRPNGAWNKYRKEFYKLGDNVDEFKAVGLVTGSISGIEVIDIDQKYDIPAEGEELLVDRYKEKVDFFLPGIWDTLTVVTTKNGGYHLVYRVKEMGGNIKLAQREATKKEKKKGEKKLVLLETRSEGGYIVCQPSEGYKTIKGKLMNPVTITVEQRDTLFACARMLDQIIPPVFMEDPKVVYNSSSLPPWSDFNERGDWRHVLTSNGWTIVSEKGSKVFVKRPNSSSPISGNFDTNYGLLRVFSTSSVFDSDKSYNPFMIYTILQCGGDPKQAARELSELGYGRILETKYKKKDEPVEFDDLHEFTAGEEADIKLEAYATGKIKQGLTTGSEEFDKYYRFKPKSMDVIGGTAGLGKTTIALLLAAISNALHNWRWIIYSTENEVFELKMYILEFLYCENIQQIPPEHRKIGLDYINKHFFFIESDDMLSHLDLFNMAEKIIQKNGKFNALLVDPINSLKIDFSETDRKLNTHQYTVEMLTKMKHWTKKTGLSLYLGMHGNTESARRVHQSGELKGNPAPLNAADLAEGVIFENKADHMILVHRYKFVPDLKTQTLLAVKKVKSTYSGGDVTPLDSPVVLKMSRGSDRNCFGFYDVNNINPLAGWFKKHILGEQTKPTTSNDINPVIEIQEDKIIENNFYKGNTLKNNRADDVFSEVIEEPPF